MSNPIAEAIRLLRSNAHIVADDCGDDDGQEMHDAADALAAYFAEPDHAEVKRLAEISAQPGRPIGGGFYVLLTPEERVRAVLNAIAGEQQ